MKRLAISKDSSSRNCLNQFVSISSSSSSSESAGASSMIDELNVRDWCARVICSWWRNAMMSPRRVTPSDERRPTVKQGVAAASSSSRSRRPVQSDGPLLPDCIDNGGRRHGEPRLRVRQGETPGEGLQPRSESSTSSSSDGPCTRTRGTCDSLSGREQVDPRRCSLLSTPCRDVDGLIDGWRWTGRCALAVTSRSLSVKM